MSRYVLEMLQCIQCGGDLKSNTNMVVCISCGASYGTHQETIFFVASSQTHPSQDRPDAFLVACKNMFKQFPKMYRFLTYVFGISYGGLSPRAFLQTHRKPHHTIVNLGAGNGERYADAIHLDLFPFSGVDVVADMTKLPFKDQSVDIVLSLAVLEHVQQPERVIHEAFRILRPGGLLYCTMPFMQPYHSSPHDYFRWTLDGFRIIASSFEEVQSGLRHGPTSALMWMLAYWLATVMSLGWQRAFDIFLVGWSMCLMPIAHIVDLPLNRLRVSENMASGYYFVGRKPR